MILFRPGSYWRCACGFEHEQQPLGAIFAVLQQAAALGPGHDPAIISQHGKRRRPFCNRNSNSRRARLGDNRSYIAPTQCLGHGGSRLFRNAVRGISRYDRNCRQAAKPAPIKTPPIVTSTGFNRTGASAQNGNNAGHNQELPCTDHHTPPCCDGSRADLAAPARSGKCSGGASASERHCTCRWRRRGPL